MILAFEMTWEGITHAPGNASTLLTFARAFPRQEIRVFADKSHLEELRGNAALAATTNVSYWPVKISPHFRGKTHVVSSRRFIREAIILFAALRDIQSDEDTLIFLLSATPTAIFAASWLLAWTRRRRVGVQIGLHGNLNELNGWRPRNPILRRFDLTSALNATPRRSLRLLVLEEAIRDELARSMPHLTSHVDVLPLPVNSAEVGEYPAPRFGEPIKVGFVGLANDDRGFDVFLRVARDMKKKFTGRIEFHHIGRAETDSSNSSNLAHPLSTVPLTRLEFVQRLSGLHYVMFPFRLGGYYNLSASGTLVDAITWLKPIIATPIPMVTRLFAQFGDVGYMFRDNDELTSVFDQIMGIDENRYRRQVAALERVRKTRTPEALAARCAEIMEAKYDRLLCDASQ